jgi:hypothetical protein
MGASSPPIGSQISAPDELAPDAAAAALSASNSDPSWAEPRCSMRREHRRYDHTIRTAIAPDLVFTVRT